MSFFSWTRAPHHQKRRETSQPAESSPTTAATPATAKDRINYTAMEPSAIADAVVLLRKENDRATELCATADLVIKGQEQELLKLRERNKQLETSNRNMAYNVKSLENALTARTVSLNQTVNQRSAQLLQAERLLKTEQEKCKTMQNELLKARLAARAGEYGDVYDDEEGLADTVSTLAKHADLRPMPFVVVLVDGDSYRFPEAGKEGGDIRGPEMAHNLYREISKYILSHPQTPPHSRIVVRVFCNRSSMEGKISKSASKAIQGGEPLLNRQPVQTVETMVKFAETYPLFDYLDCGGGKERVDDKIRENCHLYIADSSCHAVFLAVCNDNGYVRMLERYDGNPGASAKIVLLTNGSITQEMAKLSFPKVELAEVFHTRYKTKRKQGSSRKIGPILNTLGLPGFQNAADYDLEYTHPPVRQRVENMLEEMRRQKQLANAQKSLFARLPYETNERYEERMRALLPFSRPSIPYGGGNSRSVGYIGLRKNRPAGMLVTAPILPFILLVDATQSTYKRISVDGADWTLD